MKFVNKLIIRKKPQYEESITFGVCRVPSLYEIAEWNQDIQAFDRIILDLVEVTKHCCVPVMLSTAC